MTEVLLCVAFWASVTLTGYSALVLCDRAQVADEAELAILAFPAGQAVMGAVLFTLNVLGVPFGRPLTIGVMAAGSAAGLALAGARHERWLELGRRMRRFRFRPGLIGWIALAVAFVVLIAYAGMIIVGVNREYDTNLYHFPHSDVIYRTHRQPTYATQSLGEEFSFPPAIFNDYAGLWSWMGRIDQLSPNLLPIPVLLCWWLLTILAIRRLFRRSDLAAAVALLALIGTYEMTNVLGGENVDLITIVLFDGAAYYIARMLREGRPGIAPLAALMLACAFWTRYQAIPQGACLCAAVAAVSWWSSRRCRLHKDDAAGLQAPSADGALDAQWREGPLARAMAITFAGAALLASPFLIRNQIVFGSPIYPGALGPLKGIYTSPWCVQVVAAYWQPRLFMNIQTILGEAFREPAVVLAVPALWLAIRRRDSVSMAFAAAGLAYVFYFAIAMNGNCPLLLRTTAPLLGLLSWIGGCVVDDLVRPAANEDAAVEVQGILLILALAAICGFVGIVACTAFSGWVLDSGTRVTLVGSGGWLLLLGLLADLCAWGYGRTSTRYGQKEPSPAQILPAYALVLFIGIAIWTGQKPILALASFRQDLASARWDLASATDDSQAWMQRHLPANCVIYGYDCLRWGYPGAFLPADDPHFEPLHVGHPSLIKVLAVLRMMGVTTVTIDKQSNHLSRYRVFMNDPVRTYLHDRRYFVPIYENPWNAVYRVHYPGGARPCRPGPGHPMPWLYDFAAGGPMPPHPGSSPR